MSVLFIIMYVLLGIAAIGVVATGVSSRKVYGLSWRKVMALSEPAHHIVRDYRRLPSDSQVENPLPHLRVLDEKYGKKEVNKHYSVYGYESRTFSWSHGCGHYTNDTCTMREYKDIYLAINQIAKEVHRRNEKIRLAALEGDLVDAKGLAERYNEEAQLLRNVTKELT